MVNETDERIDGSMIRDRGSISQFVSGRVCVMLHLCVCVRVRVRLLIICLVLLRIVHDTTTVGGGGTRDKSKHRYSPPPPPYLTNESRAVYHDIASGHCHSDLMGQTTKLAEYSPKFKMNPLTSHNRMNP